MMISAREWLIAGHDVLASEDFARQCEGFEPVGAFEVKGFAKPIAAYAPTIG